MSEDANKNETPASGDKKLVVLENPANGKSGNYDPKTAQILVSRKGYKRKGTVSQKDQSLAAVVAK